jgi:hypothetical protein
MKGDRLDCLARLLQVVPQTTGVRFRRRLPGNCEKNKWVRANLLTNSKTRSLILTLLWQSIAQRGNRIIVIEEFFATTISYKFSIKFTWKNVMRDSEFFSSINVAQTILECEDRWSDQRSQVTTTRVWSCDRIIKRPANLFEKFALLINQKSVRRLFRGTLIKKIFTDRSCKRWVGPTMLFDECWRTQLFTWQGFGRRR